MKRVVVALGLIVFIAGVCLYSIYEIHKISNQMTTRIDTVIVSLGEKTPELLEHQIDQLCSYWYSKEHSLTHLVRHSEIDEIAKNIARLPIFAGDKDYTMLMAELHSLRWQVSHIWESEKPTLTNIV